VSKVIGHPYFDYAMGLVIMFNMLMIIVETDHAAHNDDGMPVVETIGWIILGIFIIELICRLFVHGRYFFLDGWNNFDFFVVVTDLGFSILGMILGNAFPVSTLRVLRLCKLARVSKVFRVFPELRIMMAGLLGSFRAIFWGSVLLSFVLLVWAIIAVQFIHPLNRELAENGQLEGCDRCPRAYSSVLQSTLTFAQQIVAGDSWGQATIPVIEAYPWTALYFAGVFLTVAVAVMNLILGVVVNVASGEHERLKGEMAEMASIEKMCATNNILQMCEEMDSDESGELSIAELQNLADSKAFREVIETMNINETDLAMAFETVDQDKSGSVSYTELVGMLHKMQDSSIEFMLEQIKCLITHVKILITTDQGQLLEGQTHLEGQIIKMTAAAQNPFLHSPNERAQNPFLTGKTIDTQEVGKSAPAQPLEADNNAEHNSDIPAENKADIPTKSAAAQPFEADNKATQSNKADVAIAIEAFLDNPGVEVKDGSVNFQAVGGDHHFSKEILNALLHASSHFQVDLKDSLKHLESSLELHASTTSKLLSQFARAQTPGDDVLSIMHLPLLRQDSALSDERKVPRVSNWI